MKVLTIERSKWRRGGDSDARVDEFGLTSLLNDQGQMCCLGFDAIACGFTANDISYKADPAELGEWDLRKVPDYAEARVRFTPEHDDEDDHDYNVIALSEPAGKAVEHNDDPILDDAERERLVRQDLIALGWDDVVFVD